MSLTESERGPRAIRRGGPSESFLRREVQVVRRRARWLVLGFVGGALGAFATTLLVKPPPPPAIYFKATETRVVDTGAVSPDAVSSYTVDQIPAMLLDPKVTSEIASRAGVDPKVVPADLAVTSQNGLNAIEVVAVYGDGPTAVKLAHTGAEVLSERAKATAAEQDDARRAALQTQRDELATLNDQLIAQRSAEPQNADLITKKIEITSQNFTSVDTQLSALGVAMPFDLTVLQAPQAIPINAHGAFVRRLNNLAVRDTLPGVSPLQLSTSGELDLSPPKEFSRVRRVGLGACGGLLVGLFAALLADAWDDRVRGRRSLLELPNVELLAEVPSLTRKQLRRFHLRAGGDELAAVREQFRAARAASLFTLGIDPHAPGEAGGKVLLVASPNAREGRTTVVAGLARAMADTSLRTLVVDGDLRHTSAGRLLGVIPNLAEPDRPAATRFDGVHFLRGPRRDRPVTDAVNEVIAAVERWRSDYDLLIIDSAPLLLAFDASDYLASCCDAALLVWRDGQTSLASAAESQEMVEQFGVAVVGMVLNGCESLEIRSWMGVEALDTDELADETRRPALSGASRRA